MRDVVFLKFILSGPQTFFTQRILNTIYASKKSFTLYFLLDKN